MKNYLPIICLCLCLTACFESKEDKKFINEKITQFLDMNKIAQSTPRIPLLKNIILQDKLFII